MSKKIKNSELDYLFSSASIKAMENRLLNEAAYDKLIDCRDVDDLLKNLSTQGYDVASVQTDARASDKLIALERKRLYEMLCEIAPNIDFFKFFLYSYDYLNIKVLIKANVANNAKIVFSESASIPFDVLKTEVDSREYSVLTENMAKGIEQAEKAYAATHDPQQIDIVLDKFCFADMLQAAQSSNIEFLVGYVKKTIDIANIKSYLRMKAIDKSEEFAGTVFVQGGNIEADFFTEGYLLKMEEFANLFKGDELYELLVQGIALTRQSGGMGKLELLCDNALMSYVEKAKYIPFGAQVVAGYIIAKETEFKNIQIIVAGKDAGLSAERIKERLRKPYV